MDKEILSRRDWTLQAVQAKPGISCRQLFESSPMHTEVKQVAADLNRLVKQGCLKREAGEDTHWRYFPSEGEGVKRRRKKGIAVIEPDTLPKAAAQEAQMCSVSSKAGDLSTIGGRLRHVRGTVTQNAFAKQLNTHQNTLGAWERNEREVSASALCVLHDQGINPRWVLTGMGPTGLDETPGTYLTGDARAAGDSAARPAEQPGFWRLDHHLEAVCRDLEGLVQDAVNHDVPREPLAAVIDLLLITHRLQRNEALRTTP